MDASYSEKEKSERIQEVMRQMGLKKIENTKIGAPGAANSISGGEMKRLSVASEVSCFFVNASHYHMRWLANRLALAAAS